MNLDQIKDRCTEEGDCWVWQGAVNGCGGAPKVTKTLPDGRATCVSVRRLAYLASGRQLRPGELVTVNCGNAACLNPKHLKVTTKSEVALRSNTPASRLRRAASVARFKRASGDVKLTIQLAREIRASDRTNVDWAAELGVTNSMISKVRLNQRWREFGDNPFTGLGARA